MPTYRVVKDHFVASLGEFVGTFLFLFFAFAGTATANQGGGTVSGQSLTNLLYISLVFGFSLAINVWIFFRISGGLFNPAVTLALCVCGVVPVVRSLFIFAAQILGAIAAAGVARGLIPATEVNFAVALTANTSIAQGLFLEMFLTVELVFTILMLAAEKTKATFVAPVGIGLALFVAELVGVNWTGGALNPARAFGPAVVAGQFNGYHWIYWLGPVMGALLSSAFYKLMKVLDYEEVNGDQDKSGEEEEEAQQERRENGDAEQGNEKAYKDRGQQDRDQERPRGSQRSNRSRPQTRDRSSEQHPRSSENAPGRYPYTESAQQSPRSPRSAGFGSRKSEQAERERLRRMSGSPEPVRTRDGEVYVQDGGAQTRSGGQGSGRRPNVDVKAEELRWENSRRESRAKKTAASGDGEVAYRELESGF